MEDLKQIIKDRMDQLELTPYTLSIEYGKLLEPEFQGTDRDIGNRYLSRIRKAVTQPEKCQIETLTTLLKVLNGSLSIEFVDKKIHKLTN